MLNMIILHHVKAYKELGFAEAELLVEFGYPTQKLVLFSKNGGSTNE